MQHYNIWENCIRKVIHEAGEVTVDHIGEFGNPAEHTSDETFRSRHDHFLFPRLDGGVRLIELPNKSKISQI